jgi:hypothetical protein
MKSQPDEPVIIELDDPAPRGARFIAVVVGIVLVVLIIAPFMLKSGIEPEEVDASRTPRTASNAQICQPAVNLPQVLDPVTHLALPSWMRLCDWFTDPGQPAIDRPPRT